MFLYPPQFKNAPVKATIIKRKMKESGGLSFWISENCLIFRIPGTFDAVKRIMHNPMVILYFLGNTFRYFGNGGFYMLLAKYIESQYRRSSASASLITGSSSILPISIGILLGGLFISFYKPKVRLLLTLVFLAEFTSFFTTGSGILLGCDPIKLDFGECGKQCDCGTRVFTPICGPDSKTTYFSPCYAGCKAYNEANLVMKSFG